MRLIHFRAGVLIAAMALFTGAGLVAQGGQIQGQAQGQGRQGRGRGMPAPPPQNLQVLPKDWTGQQVQSLMRTFTGGLGVQCDHCHVSREDRASDDKPEKLEARKMLRMVLAINNDFLKDIGEPPAEIPGVPMALKVTCYTCHRGSLKPVSMPPPGGGGGR